MLPILETLSELGGRAAAAEVIDAVTERFDVPEAVRNERVTYTWERWGCRERNPWRQNIHWVRQEAATRGFIGRGERGIWTLTDRGADTLRNCQPGVILVVFETKHGGAIWADAITAAGAIRDESIDLIFQSPPYPILNGRQYGTFSEAELIDLIMKCAPDWRRGLKATGSMVLNLKDCWLPSKITGGAARSIYIDKLVCALVEDAKFSLADRHFWRNPACAPTTPFVTVQKVRAACDLEHVLWFSKTANPFADARAIMEPAKPATVATYLAKAKRGQQSRVCESGHNNVFEEQLAKALAGEEIKVLPRTVQEFANSAPQVKLKEMLSSAGLPPHPARMPIELAKHWIKFLTRPGDEVRDFFAGSLTTGLAAEELGRHWACSERSLAYLLGGSLRFGQANVRFEPSSAHL
jgi:site-specific DNA-methyltransferase (cytosine-N4-specific)